LVDIAFNRRNRMWLARLEGFAHDPYVRLTLKTGNGQPAGTESRKLHG
jgi:hypothetical protein